MVTIQKWQKWHIVIISIISTLIIIPATIFILIYYTDFIVLEKYGHLISDRVIWSIKTDEKFVAFTFDDGPNETYTPRLLDILAQKEVKVTFFLLGKHVEKYPDIVKRIYSDGHEIGNHTFNHDFLPLYRKSYIKRQIESTSALIEETVGIKPSYFRPPMGLFTPSVLNAVSESGLTAVVGEVYPRDPYKPGIDKIVERVMSRVQPGSIIILHDSGTFGKVDRSQTIAAVSILIDRLRENDYQFLTLSKLIISGKSKH